MSARDFPNTRDSAIPQAMVPPMSTAPKPNTDRRTARAASGAVRAAMNTAAISRGPGSKPPRARPAQAARYAGMLMPS